MKRLTEKRDNQNVIPLRQDGNEKWALASAGMGDAPTQFLYGSHADLLASYEDTNLIPEQIVEIDRAYRDKCEEIAKYQRLEEDGLFLRLPCKLGDTLYIISRGEIIPLVVEYFTFSERGIRIFGMNERYFGNGTITLYPDKRIVEWFLSQEEAESVLSKNAITY